MPFFLLKKTDLFGIFFFSLTFGLDFLLRRQQISVLNSITIKIRSFMAFKPGGGEKSSERKAAFSPPPGPPPLFWPRLSCKKMPAAFSTNWASSRKEEYELGEEINLSTKNTCPTQNLSSAAQPSRNRSPEGLRTYRRRLWVDGDGAPGKGQSKVDPLIWTRQPLCIKQC